MNDLKELFEKTLGTLIRLKLGINIYEYLIDDRIKEFRNFEFELDSRNSITGTGIKFSTQLFAAWKNPSDNVHIVNEEKELSSIDITSELAAEPFRYKEMSFVYMFTILEDFGNSVVNLVNNQYYQSEIVGKQGSWHSKVNHHAKTAGKDLAAGFAQAFGLSPQNIDHKFVELLYELKQKRNSIAHALHYPDSNNYRTDLKSLIVMLCYVYHINDLTKSEVTFYPWEDYDG